SPFPAFEPGQHFDIRLTSENGYQAQRSYSAASASSQNEYLEFGIDVLPDGEVSGYLATLKPDDKFEIRGPIGRHFIWNPGNAKETILIGGGSGVVPLFSMIREYSAARVQDKLTFINSFRTVRDIPWQDELENLAQENQNLDLYTTITRESRVSERYHSGRINREILNKALEKYNLETAAVYICGSNSFVEAVSQSLLDLGAAFHNIKTERYG
ncbi:oxidoreductase, partial [Candidatus Dojkabacteria bacterium]|nr:oxidoreductase [Candidatus Dojkabacteria bacterium]